MASCVKDSTLVCSCVIKYLEFSTGMKPAKEVGKQEEEKNKQLWMVGNLSRRVLSSGRCSYGSDKMSISIMDHKAFVDD